VDSAALWKADGAIGGLHLVEGAVEVGQVGQDKIEVLEGGDGVRRAEAGEDVGEKERLGEELAAGGHVEEGEGVRGGGDGVVDDDEDGEGEDGRYAEEGEHREGGGRGVGAADPLIDRREKCVEGGGKERGGGGGGGWCAAGRGGKRVRPGIPHEEGSEEGGGDNDSGAAGARV
jgi:hypothetical protein